MKHFIFLTLILVLPMLGRAQDENIGKFFKANAPISIRDYDYTLGVINTTMTPLILSVDHRIKIIDKTTLPGGKEYYIIKVYNYYYGVDKMIKPKDIGDPTYVITTLSDDKKKKELDRDVNLTSIAASNIKVYNKYGLSLSSADETLIKDDGGEYFEIFPVLKTSSNASGTGYLISKEEAEYHTFVLPVNSIGSFTAIEETWFRSSSINGSVANIPLKARFSGKGKNEGDNFNDFTANFNLGVSLNFNMRTSRVKENYIGILAGANVSSIPFNRDEYDNLSADVFSSNLTAFTPHVGIYYSTGRLNMMIGGGKDYLAKELNNQWKFKNHPFLYIGIGYDIIEKSSPADKNLKLEPL